MDSFGEFPRLLQVRPGGLAPQEVRVRGIGAAAGDRALQSRLDREESFPCAAPGGVDEGPVALVDIRGQELGALRIGACDQHRRHIAHVRRQARRDQLVDRLLGGHENLAPHVTAFLGRRQLILEVNPGSARIDHLLHELEGVEHAAEARLRIGHDRLQPVDGVVPFGMVDFIRAAQGVVDAPHHRRHRIRRIQRLIRVHLAREVGIARHLPAGQVDGIQSRLHLLHGLITRQGAECVHEWPLAQVAPQFLRGEPRDRVLHGNGAAQAHHVLGVIGAPHAAPARRLAPVAPQLIGSGHRFSSVHGPGAPLAPALVSSAAGQLSSS